MRRSLTLLSFVLCLNLSYSQQQWINFTGHDGVANYQLLGDTLWVSFAGGISWIDINTDTLLHNFTSANSGLNGNTVGEFVLSPSRKAWWLGQDTAPASGTDLANISRLQYFNGQDFAPAATNLSLLDTDYPLQDLCVSDNDELYFKQYLDFNTSKLWQLVNEELSEIQLPDGYENINDLYVDTEGRLMGFLGFGELSLGIWQDDTWTIHDLSTLFEQNSQLYEVRTYGIGPDGYLYIDLSTSFFDDFLIRYNGTDWELLMGLNDNHLGVTWAPNGELYVIFDNVLRQIENWELTNHIYLPSPGGNQAYIHHLWKNNNELYSLNTAGGAILEHIYINESEKTQVQPGNSPLRSNRVLQLGVSTDFLKTMYIGNREYMSFDGEEWQYFTIPDLLPGNSENEIRILPNQSGEVYIFADEGQHQFLKYDGTNLEENFLTNLQCDNVFMNGDDLYFFSYFYNDRFGKLDDATGQFSETDIPLSNLSGRQNFVVDSENKIWTFNDFYLVEAPQYFDGETWQNLEWPTNFIGGDDISTFIDSEDFVYFINFAGKVFKYDQTNASWEILDLGGIADLIVFNDQMIEDSKGNLWIMNDNYGLFKYNGLEWTQFDHVTAGLSSTSFFDIDIDPLDNIWISTNTGLSVFNEEGITNLGATPFYRLAGNVYYDINENESYDEGTDAKFIQVDLKVEPFEELLFTNNGGRYGANVVPGDYTVRLGDITHWTAEEGNEQLITIEDQSELNVDFRMVPDSLFDQVDLQFTATSARCGRAVNYYLALTNTGTSILEGRLALNPDPLTDIIELPAGFAYDDTDNTYYLEFENLLPLELRQFEFLVQIPNFNFLGEELLWEARVQLLEDGMYEDLFNTTFDQIVECSYDPNDKLVRVNGPTQGETSLAEDELLYTVRFQNTGNAVAFDVEIIDTIDQQFDLNTFRVIQASHDFETYIEDENIVHFVFANINLPDSTSNEPESHGLVQYAIKAKTDLVLPVEVRNTAYIYFDQNPPIQTNTTSNILLLEFPVSTREEAEQVLQGLIYPNPTSDQLNLRLEQTLDRLEVQLINLHGQVLQSLVLDSPTNQLQLNCDQLSTGFYILKVRSSQRQGAWSFIKD